MLRILKLFLPVLLFSSFIKGKNEHYPFEKWTAEELAQANSAKDVSYMSDEEKAVIFYTNLVRINPKLFGETYAKKYIDSAGFHDSYAKSLLNTLKKTNGMTALQPDSALASTAADHARLSGKTGRTGHSGKNKRFKEVQGTYNLWGENCSYGYSGALDIVMQLLIDEKNPDYGHRKNILDKDFTHVGAAIREHRKYKWNCVQDFGGTAHPGKR